MFIPDATHTHLSCRALGTQCSWQPHFPSGKDLQTSQTHTLFFVSSDSIVHSGFKTMDSGSLRCRHCHGASIRYAGEGWDIKVTDASGEF